MVADEKLRQPITKVNHRWGWWIVDWRSDGRQETDEDEPQISRIDTEANEFNPCSSVESATNLYAPGTQL